MEFLIKFCLGIDCGPCWSKYTILYIKFIQTYKVELVVKVFIHVCCVLFNDLMECHFPQIFYFYFPNR